MADYFSARLIELRLTAAVREMGISMIQTSGSPAITEAKDFSTAIFDAEGELIAFGGFAAFHVGAAIEGVRCVRSMFSESDIEAGEGFLVNDPYTSGALHVGDIGIVWPVFWGGRIVAWSYTNAHQTDIGGVSPGGLAAGASECFAEGLMFPPTRIVVGGEFVEEWLRFISNNVRTPLNVVGDMRSLLAANRTAERHVTELVNEFGLDTFVAANALNKSTAEKAVRERIASLPDATAESDEWMDYERDGELSVYRIAVKLTIDGDSMVVDLSDSAAQAAAPVNTCRPAVVGGIYTAFAQKMAWDLPMNAGTFRPIDIEIGTPGKITNPRKPAPNSIGHVATGARLVRGLSSLFTRFMQASRLPELRAQVSGTASDGLVRGAWVGRDKAGNTFAFLGQDQIPGLGARTRGDGLDVGGLQFGLGIEITDIEIAESQQPILYLWRRLNANSGGPGTHRGGLGVDLAWMPYGTDQMAGTVFCTASRFPGRGELGGMPGSTGFMGRGAGVIGAPARSIPHLRRYPEEAEWADLPSYGAGIRVNKGDVVRVWSPGGGGLGDPGRRDPARTHTDLVSGRISTNHAEHAYGLRQDGQTTADPVMPSQSHAVLRCDENNARACGGCGGELGDWREPLNSVSCVEEADLAETLEALEMHAKTDIEGLVLQTCRCPHCKAALDRAIIWKPMEAFVEQQHGLFVRSRAAARSEEPA
ncbi:MAG: hydantoinase B/oxoprolinase family protein [Defluviicoccus sp.]|nr:hydantoinase B/oxoprolinase family protein [Defluviicoccus sp.]MDE0386834.1 hydantoinase B/oxoprolinase family protein [Defluviicoccus sp.]